DVYIAVQRRLRRQSQALVAAAQRAGEIGCDAAGLRAVGEELQRKAAVARRRVGLQRRQAQLDRRIAEYRYVAAFPLQAEAAVEPIAEFEVPCAAAGEVGADRRVGLCVVQQFADLQMREAAARGQSAFVADELFDGEDGILADGKAEAVQPH